MGARSTAALVVGAFVAVRRRLARRSLPLRRARLLPDASTPASSSCTCAARPGTRIEETEKRIARDRATRSASVDPAATRSRRCSTTSASPYSGINLSLSEGALISPADGADPDRAQGRPRADRRATCARCATTLRQRLPRDDVLLPRARHLDAGAELRPRGADRRAGRRRRSAARTRRSRSREQLADADREGARRGRRAPRAGARACPQLAVDVDRTMAQQVGLTERDVASDLLVSLSSSGAGRADLLARQARRAVPRRGADAAVRDRLDRRAARDADLDRRRRSRRPLGNVATIDARRRAGEHHALQRRAHLRRAGQRRRHRPRLGRRRASTQIVARRREAAAARHADRRVKGQVESMDSVVRRPRATASSSRSCSSTC